MFQFKNAFTLIELLIVVAIIGILAAIAVPNFLNAQIRAKIARSQADMRSLGTGIETFRIDQNVLLVDVWDKDQPEGVERIKVFGVGSIENVFPPSRTHVDIYAPLTSPVSYMSSIPNDPFLGKVSNTEDRIIIVLNGKYWYGDNDPGIPGENHNFGALKPSNAERFGLQPLLKNQWVLIGTGPDTLAEEIGDNALRGLSYNASNGLHSKGDIWLRSGGGTNQ